MPASTPLVQHIRYECPYGGHPILRRKPEDAYAAVQEFLTECTDWDGRWTDNQLGVFEAGSNTPGWSDHAVKPLVTRRLGRGRVNMFINSPTGQAQGQCTWDVPEKDHRWAVDLAFAQPRSPRGHLDPVSCTSSLSFRLRVPRGRVLPGQSRSDDRGGLAVRSSAMVHWSSGNSSMMVTLALPFAEPDRRFVAYVRSIRPYLPVRLAKSNFRVWVPKKAGGGYKLRRVDAGVVARER